MDIQGAINKLVQGVQNLQTWSGLLVIAVVAFVLTIGATHFLRKDERGTEEGKTLIKNGIIAVIIVGIVWTATHAVFTWSQGIL